MSGGFQKKHPGEKPGCFDEEDYDIIPTDNAAGSHASHMSDDNISEFRALHFCCTLH